MASMTRNEELIGCYGHLAFVAGYFFAIVYHGVASYRHWKAVKVLAGFEDKIVGGYRRENFPFGSEIVPLPKRKSGGFQRLPPANPKGMGQSFNSKRRPMNKPSEYGVKPPQYEQA